MKHHKFLLFFVFIFLVTGCKKKVTPATPNPPTTNDTTHVQDSTNSNPVVDYIPIPFDSVKWIIHYQGAVVGDSTGYHFDSFYHFYTTVTPSGLYDTINNNVYLIYNAEITQIHSSNPHSESHKSVRIKIRQDTLNKKFYSRVECTGCVLNEYLVIDYNEAVNDQVSPSCYWPSSIVNQIDSITIDHKQYKQWTIMTNSKPYFYKAYLIGGQFGFVPIDNYSVFSGPCAQARSLDFIYKNDSLHFDFDFYSHW